MATKEKQYNAPLADYYDKGPVKLGFMTSHTWRTDPRRFVFSLVRYKFIAKLLSGYDNVIEIGCGDGFGAELVLQEVNKLYCVDFDPEIIRHCKEERPVTKRLSFAVKDLRKETIAPKKDAAYALDVLEHVAKKDESNFLMNIAMSLKNDGVCIIGTPSLESQVYASKWSREGHVNCKKGVDLKSLMKKYFDVVYLFSMNDEVVHTGFYQMAHYLIAVGTHPKIFRKNVNGRK